MKATKKLSKKKSISELEDIARERPLTPSELYSLGNSEREVSLYNSECDRYNLGVDRYNAKR